MERHFNLRIDDKLLKKFRYVCAYHGRSANQQLLQMIKRLIAAYEKEFGEIPLDEEK